MRAWAASTQVDLSLKLKRKEYEERLAVAQERLVQLRLHCGGLTGPGELGPPVCCVFEGWDASGKGGAIKRLLQEVDVRHVRVRSYSAPTPDEKRHHFLWRFWPNLPGWGGMAVYDRSWYGRVLVERVEGFAEEKDWRRGYDEIVEFERTLAAEGMMLVKFWMHISDEEQLERFEKRRADPLKSWKLTDEDWRNREQAQGVLRGGRGDARAHRHRARAVARRPGRQQEVRAGVRDRDGERGDRARAGQAGAAGAPTTAQRRLLNRRPSVARRTAISASSPHHTPMIPHSRWRVSSAIGT